METIYFTNLRKLDKFSIDWKLHAVNSHNSSGRCGDDGGEVKFWITFYLMVEISKGEDPVTL